LIAKDSSSYPCLAVIQHFKLEAHAGEVYGFGRRLLEAITGMGPKINFEDYPTCLRGAALHQLQSNYVAAATKFGWGAFR
jgi:hypothetical protein